MKGLSVKIGNIDESDESVPALFYRSRTAVLKLREGEIKTPCRAVSRSELNAKKNVPITRPIASSGSLVVDVHDLSESELVQFLDTNGAYRKIYDKTMDVLKRAQNASMVVIILQPCQNAYHILSDQEKRDQFLRMWFALQSEIDSPILSVPYVGDLEDERFVGDTIRAAETQGIGADLMFVVDLRHDVRKFKGIIDAVKEAVGTGATNVLGLIYRPHRDCAATYDYVWRTFKEEDVAILMLNIPRYDPNDSVSMPHFTEFRLGDIYCVKNPMRLPLPGANALSRVRFLDRDSLTLPSLDVAVPDTEGVVSQLGVDCKCDREFVSRLFADLDSLDDEKIKRIAYLSKVHEVLVSSTEMGISREFIDEGDAVSYLEKKRPLYRKLRS
ncbi:MAG: hypothetical protein QHH00_08350 [Methanomassiliicoccales archaeon]|jgi:hypothetical protein|nr:hypothetical protein [Methanomassiliicoccales archaeon]